MVVELGSFPITTNTLKWNAVSKVGARGRLTRTNLKMGYFLEARASRPPHGGPELRAFKGKPDLDRFPGKPLSRGFVSRIINHNKELT